MMPEKIDSKDVRLDVVDFIVAGKCLDAKPQLLRVSTVKTGHASTLKTV